MPTEYRLTSSEALDEESTCLSILSLIRVRKKKQHTLHYEKKYSYGTTRAFQNPAIVYWLVPGWKKNVYQLGSAQGNIMKGAWQLIKFSLEKNEKVINCTEWVSNFTLTSIALKVLLIDILWSIFKRNLEMLVPGKKWFFSFRGRWQSRAIHIMCDLFSSGCIIVITTCVYWQLEFNLNSQLKIQDKVY